MPDHVFRCVNVAAVSTPGQAADDKASIPHQLETMSEIVERNGWIETARLIIPGFTRDYMFMADLVRDCPEYAELVRLIESDTIDLILCWRYDRVWRNDFVRADLARIRCLHQVQVYAVTQGRPPRPPDEINWRRPGWDVTEEVISGIASADEQRRRIDRMTMGMKDRIEKRGLQKFTRPAYGYMIDDDRNLIPNPDEAHWVVWAYEERAKGRGVHGIANELTTRGVPTPNAFHQRRWRGKPAHAFWYEQTLRRILKNALYAGAVKWGDYFSWDGAHEPLISRDLYDRVQRLWGRRLPSRPRTVHWLSGLIRCGRCGYAMCYERSRAQWYLRCRHNRRSANTECTGNWHTARVVEALVQGNIIAMLSDEGRWREARSGQGSLPAILEQIAYLDDAIKRNRESDKRAYRAFVAGLADEATTKETHDELQEAWEQMKKERAVLDGSARSAQSALAVYQSVASIADEFADLPVEKKRELTFLLVDKVVLVQGEDPVIVWA